ncbi:Hypothetical Protein SCAB [Streptomyces leeuwenhoekii]|uniref:Uncharacterized protein n=1 Tax=Streptomyces leeuwenhoekii TaxID=1437453 RepID=A0A0F7VZ12_STRLW|nr:hypothetical protein [Streptomyces leeuwenhoekii]CQR62767.1 Hypothetical Protein SCAB [Streptomyces leeuwenhoekii]
MLLGLLAGWLIRQQRRRPSDPTRWRGTVAVPVAAVAALGCTAYSADTSWRFAADYLDMGGTAERVAMFAAAELALFATALMARQNLNGPKQAPGLPGTLTWVITAVQILPAYAESGLVGGTVRAFVGPVMAAMLWHLAMGIELRHRAPDAASRSLSAVLVRQARERLLARLGIADQDADAARLIRDRALSEAVALILRAEATGGNTSRKRRQRRLTERLHKALERADVDGDPLQDERLLRKLATRKQALDLASMTLPPRWAVPASYTARGSGLSRPRPARPEPLPRAEDAARPHPSDPGDDEVPPTARPQPARPVPGLPARAEIGDSRPLTGNSSGSLSGRRERKQAARKKRDAGRARASDEVILKHTRRIYEETGSVGRDRVEDALRAAATPSPATASDESSASSRPSSRPQPTIHSADPRSTSTPNQTPIRKAPCTPRTRKPPRPMRNPCRPPLPRAEQVGGSDTPPQGERPNPAPPRGWRGPSGARGRRTGRLRPRADRSQARPAAKAGPGRGSRVRVTRGSAPLTASASTSTSSPSSRPAPTTSA